MSLILNVKNLNKNYIQGRSIISVLNSINFKLKSKEICSILGSSGSGKSTFLHILGSLDKIYEGNIEIENQNLKTLNSKAIDKLRLNKIGFIYQYHHLLKDFNARENVAMPLIIRGNNNEKSLRDADNILSELGLKSRIFNYPEELSGGEKQRVAIARALINKPKLILADEPTGNLDNKNSIDVAEMIVKMVKKYSLSALVVTHNLQIAKMFDKTYKMDNGIISLCK